MFEIQGRVHRSCDGATRRSFLRVGALGLGSLTLPALLHHQAHAAASGQPVKKKAVILVWLAGGPSHIDMYDLKPDAPAEFRGEFSPIRTNVSGIEIGEHLPLQSKIMDKMSIVRSAWHTNAGHGMGLPWMLTGYQPTIELNDNIYPLLGSIVAKMRGANEPGLPAYVNLPRMLDFGKAAHLGASYNPFAPDNDPNADGFAVRNLKLPGRVDLSRLERRQGLLKTLDGIRRDVVEAEPNDTSDKPQAVALPVVVAGRFDQPRDADWFEVTSPEGGKVSLEVFCERIRGNADPYLVVLDEQNNRIMEVDDFGHRMQAFDGHLRDPVTTMDFAAGKKYRVLVQDRYRRGGVRYQYVLAAGPVRPDFYAAVIHSQNPGPGGTTLWRSGSWHLDVIIHQTDGFNGDVTITAESLPAGMHAQPTVVNNNSRGTFVLWADDNGADFVGPIKLWATAKRGEETIKREVRSYSRVLNDLGGSQPSRDLVIAVRDGAPYRLEWASDRIEVEAGKIAEAKLKLVRRWPDFKNELSVQNLAFPGNFQMNNASFAGEQAEITLPITVQGGTRLGEYTLAVLGQGQVPFNKDAKATDRPNTLVSLPSRPLTLVVKPSP